jgi:hypothetical protein
MWRQTAKFGLELCFGARRFLGVSARARRARISGETTRILHGKEWIRQRVSEKTLESDRAHHASHCTQTVRDWHLKLLTEKSRSVSDERSGRFLVREQ